ncbi:MAG: aldehyde dehydrogenase family protein [Acidimicrobiales bacterium]
MPEPGPDGTTEARLFVAGEWCDGAHQVTLNDKFTGDEVGTAHRASRAQVERALRALADAQASIEWRPYERYEVLARAASLLAERREDAARTVVVDSGFTITDARREVDRATQTLLLSAEEAKRIVGEMVPVDAAPGGSRRLALTVLHPLGVICAITPFNSPLNTVLHKVAPALAAGNAVLLKPASATPLTAVYLVRLLLDAGVPRGLLSVVHGGGGDVGQWILESEIPAFYAFTGSTEVGAHIRRSVGLRRTQLEMGSLSSTIVCDDADVAACVPLCINAAFRKAGQVCTSVQRLYVQDSVVDDVLDALQAGIGGRHSGDPWDERTFVGPLISAGEADRVGAWVGDACAAGAKIVVGGGRHGSVVEPTVVTNVSNDMKVMCEEVFGPVMVVRAFSRLDSAIDEVNDTPYGLSAGLFTRDIDRALAAASRLRMGAVHINETSSSRVDLMPYTGVKASGAGREGPHWAIREMSEERLITIGPMTRPAPGA